MNNNFYTYPMAAYIRGYALKNNILNISDELVSKPLEDMTQNDIETLIEIGKRENLKLYKFKNNNIGLPRVNRVMGFLKSISFESLLDVGSGRGAFLFPFLSEFPWVKATSVDILDHRVDFLSVLSAGGISHFSAEKGDICELSLPDNSFDVVTLLEVLEHIPNVGEAVKNAVRLASSFVLVSVPSHEDDNPEHIHLLTKEKLTSLFAEAGCNRLRFDSVSGHLIAIANMKEKKG